MALLKTPLFILLVLITFAGAAQDVQYSILREKILKAKDDTTKVNALLDYSSEVYNTSPQLAMDYNIQARDLARQIDFKKGLAAALKAIGLAYYTQGNYTEAAVNWEQSLKEFEAIGDKEGIANLLSNIGAIYSIYSDDAKALEYYYKSLKFSEQIGNKLRIATALINIGSVYFNTPATHDKSLEYNLKAFELGTTIDDKNVIGTAAGNIGEIYLERGDEKQALSYFKRSLIAYEGSENIPYALNNLGKYYTKQGDFRTAINYHEKAYATASKLSAKHDMIPSLLGMADANVKQGNLHDALSFYRRAEDKAEFIGMNYELKNAYEGLATTYARLSDYNNAYRYQAMVSGLKDTLYSEKTSKRITGLTLNFEIQKKQGEIDLLTKDKALQDLVLKRQLQTKNSLIAGMVLIFFIAFILFRNNRIKVRTNKLLDKQKAEIEKLLGNILPEEVAKELQRDGHATPRYYESVSVLFTDFKNFTLLADTYSPQELVAELNEYFIAFDDIIEKHHLEKIKTIGDAYMCAGGIPFNDDTHPVNIVNAAMDIQAYINEQNENRRRKNMPPWDLRIGIHTGPVVAGVVGKKKYAYDIWGSTVNIANRMESNGEPGKINISAVTYELVKHKFDCSYRGQIFAKNVGEIDMYFVEKELPKVISINTAVGELQSAHQ